MLLAGLAGKRLPGLAWLAGWLAGKRLAGWAGLAGWLGWLGWLAGLAGLGWAGLGLCWAFNRLLGRIGQNPAETGRV